MSASLRACCGGAHRNTQSAEAVAHDLGDAMHFTNCFRGTLGYFLSTNDPRKVIAEVAGEVGAFSSTAEGVLATHIECIFLLSNDTKRRDSATKNREQAGVVASHMPLGQSRLTSVNLTFGPLGPPNLTVRFLNFPVRGASVLPDLGST